MVDTIGFNDQGWLDASGHTHSDALRVTERFHRRDFGHLEVEVRLDDPKTFTKPVTIRFTRNSCPDTELIESFCAEGEQDVAHMKPSDQTRFLMISTTPRSPSTFTQSPVSITLSGS